MNSNESFLGLLICLLVSFWKLDFSVFWKKEKKRKTFFFTILSTKDEQKKQKKIIIKKTVKAKLFNFALCLWSSLILCDSNGFICFIF